MPARQNEIGWQPQATERGEIRAASKSGMLDLGIKALIITNDLVTTEDAKHVRRVLKGVLLEECIVGVNGACPHRAVRKGPSMNLAAGGW